MIVCTTYTSLGGIEFCEEVQSFDLDPIEEDSDSIEDDINERMDGDFDSAMKSAGFGTDEDYGDEISPMGIWGQFLMYKFAYEHAARTFAYQKGQSGWDTIVTECEGYWWVEVL